MEVVHENGGMVDLAENIVRAFQDPSLFRKFDDGDDYYVDSYDLPFEIDKHLIDVNQYCDCNWGVIHYVEKTANVKIYAGERDGFGWLSGVIEPKVKPEWTNGRSVCIMYG